MSNNLPVLHLKAGQQLTAEDRMPYILEVRDMLESGVSSLGKIQKMFNVSQDTARIWRKAALVLLEKDNNGFTRDALRNMQIARMNYWIEHTSERLKGMAGKEDTKHYAQLMERLTALSSEIARIAGLNLDTHMNMNVTRYVQINRPTVTPADNIEIKPDTTDTEPVDNSPITPS